MPDYLERVVLAGARTSIPARPMAKAPPRTPEVSQPWFPPLETVELLDGEEQLSVRSAGLPAAAQTTMPGGATSREPSPEVLAPKAGERKQTPAVPVAVAKGSAESAPPMPHNPPSVLGGPAPSDAVAIIRAPTGLRPTLAGVDLMEVRQTVTTSPSIAEVEHERLTPVPPVQPGVVLPPDPRPKASADPIPSRQIEADPSSTAEIEQHRITLAPSLQQRDASHPNLWPLPAQQAPAASIFTSANGRQSRITIGRIDVQVNNQPPAPPSAPPSPGTSPIAADILEQRFLSRFTLKF